MPNGSKRIPAVFYRWASGGEPVRDWLKGLPVDVRHVLGRDIATVEFGWPVGMPVCRPSGRGIGEARSSLPSNGIARGLFCIAEDRKVLLHGFVKKTQKTPPDDFALARARKQEIDS